MSRELKSGKMQFNAKSAKGFRDTLAKWHNADFELAVALDKKAKAVSRKQESIKNCEDNITSIENGTMLTSMKSVEDYKHDIECLLAEIKHESEVITELRNEQKSRLESAYELLSKDLHNAYVDYIKNGNRKRHRSQLRYSR